MTRIFVYGTLKRGYGNNRLLAGQTFVGEAETALDYRLFDNGFYPVMVEGWLFPDVAGVSVKGEVWEVDYACLLLIDRLEGVPHNYYRASVKLSDGSWAQAYLYRHSVEKMKDCGNSWPRIEKEVVPEGV